LIKASISNNNKQLQSTHFFLQHNTNKSYNVVH
jgi:hypothetical protein